MTGAVSRFPIPKFWFCVFSVWSCGVLFALSYLLTACLELKHPGTVLLGLALLVVPALFGLLHKLGAYADARGWILYFRPKTVGLGAGVVLDLELWVTGRDQPIEQIRLAREVSGESQVEDGLGDPPCPGHASSLCLRESDKA
jgi:hypothetical protein